LFLGFLVFGAGLRSGSVRREGQKVALHAAARDNASMRERAVNFACALAALIVLSLGVSLQWAFMTVVYAALGTLVLGLAATRLIALITARLHRTEKGDS
jgi:hypothetical protein